MLKSAAVAYLCCIYVKEPIRYAYQKLAIPRIADVLANKLQNGCLAFWISCACQNIIG